ncbi:hypothetical protein [Paraliomyxa miuraensis]|uniref:hypothetical protein n=1 Tax=Paraliomyxa miuraensis TaxID=376150 RepID=UPI00225644FB|nr:hypothetical protein [Paraliomyxa miuraensis]MCX4247232.1 hypothetical protein [Paraliomyxa miuraensis]
MTRTPRFVLGLSLLSLLGPSACGGDDVSAVDDGTGINSLDGGSSGTGTGTTGEDTEIGDVTGSMPSCENGVRDEGEADVDCGVACQPCGPGSQCERPEDCDTMICSGGFCQTPTCYDGLQNGSEQGVDCGGTCPNQCGETGCRIDAQCEQGEFCHEGECAPSSCENDLQDTQESDVDCGGPSCPDCGPGQGCGSDADCTTEVCGDDGLCADPSCTDDVHNGDETDEDCGGSCSVCPNGSNCMVGADCMDGVCNGGVCVNDSCIDMVDNGSETDVDCGGPQCPNCADGLGCNDAGDCISGVCTGGVCIGALCNDMVQNGNESDVDCGGTCGATCTTGQDCNASGDCVQGVCEFGQCSAPDCADGVQNGNETDMDCGGTCGATCIPGETCGIAGDCTQGVCNGGVCQVATCMDGVDNGNETDVDCGGVCGATCIPGEGCLNGGDCTEGVCVLGTCQAPTCSDGIQNGVEQGIDCAGICDQPCGIGGELVVNTTLPDFQVQPVVAAAPGGAYFVVAWSSFPVANPPQDGNGSGVYLRVYDSTGAPVTGEVQVNTTVMGNQQFPAIDASDAAFVVAWQGPDGSGNGVFARRFSAAGAPIGGEITVPAAAANEQRRPDVAMASDGTFVVCWEYQLATMDIVCRRFTAGGLPAAGEQTIHTVTNNNQNLPVVEVANNGDWTVAWQSAGGQDGDGTGVFKRRFNAAGVAQDPADVQVNQFNALEQQGPAIGMNALGQHVITWSSDNQDGSSTGVVARRYSAAGAAVGGEFLVNTTTAGAQNNPVVALNADGDFVIAWQTADDGVLTGVFAQRYANNGAVFNAEFTVNPTVFGLQEEPDVAVRGVDEIVGVWSEGDVGFTNRDIRMQRYDGQFP